MMAIDVECKCLLLLAYTRLKKEKKTFGERKSVHIYYYDVALMSDHFNVDVLTTLLLS